jgi:hypothetical protein
MGTVCGAEGIIDINFSKRGQLFGKAGVVFFLLRMKAQVFQKQNLTLFYFL